MTRFVVVWSLRRGIVDREPLPADDQLAAFQQAYSDALQDAMTLRCLMPRGARKTKNSGSLTLGHE
jgi:hypothetical protein